MEKVKKAKVDVGYTNSDLAHYTHFKKARMVGADIEAEDGLGNKIEVHVREGDIGYVVRVNDKEISRAGKIV